MTSAITRHVPKPRRRPSIRGHKGIERGSPDAARLFWSDADVIGQAAGPAGSAKLPDHSRYGFKGPPTPPDHESCDRADAWHRRDRECARASFMKLTPEQRARFYWGAVDHCSMGDGGGPDAYVFGYDEIPAVRPAEYPEPDFIREIRELRAGAASMPVGDALAAFGLTSAATAQDVQRAYGRIVRDQKMHPDQGGDQAAFVRFTAMRDRALSFVTPSEDR